jgi:hypothetical protein
MGSLYFTGKLSYLAQTLFCVIWNNETGIQVFAQ